MPNMVFQYIDRPNGKNGSTYGAFLIYTDDNTYVIHASGRNITYLYRYMGNGDVSLGRERLSEFMELPSFTLNPAQYNAIAGTDGTATPFVMPGKGYRYPY